MAQVVENSLEQVLLEKFPSLYPEIKQKSLNELKLPMHQGTSLIGFGKILDFYLFWISIKRGTFYFKARKRFEKPKGKKGNLVVLELTDENRDEILSAIDVIYADYLRSLSEDRFSKEMTRIETNQERRQTVKKNQAIAPPIELLWNDVTVAVWEKAEEICDTEIHAYNESLPLLQEIGSATVTQFERIIKLCCEIMSPSLSRNFSIYWAYLQTDKTTLASVASQYDLSRERVRQVTTRVRNRLFYHFKKALLFDHEEYNRCIEALAELFERIGYDIRALVAFGLNGISNRKKEAFLCLVFGEEFCQRIMVEQRQLAIETQAQQALAQKEATLRQEWDKLASKICYPSDTSASLPVSGLEQEFEYPFEKKMQAKLQKFVSLLEIIEHPDLVYYSSQTTDHRPHFLLRLPDGKNILVLTLPTINMALIYNIRRCNELHRFCKERGYGYLILDDRGNSIYDLKNRTLSPELTEQLDTFLQAQGRIVWANIKEIKHRCPVTNADLAAYVLQNKFHFTLNPFCIRYRKDS